MTDIAKIGIAVDTSAVKKAEADLARFNRQAEETERATRQAEKSAAAMSAAMKGIGAAIAVGAAVAAIKGISSALLDAQIQAEKLRATLKTVAGDNAGGARELQYIREQARAMGLELGTAAEAYAKLAASARGTTMEGQLIRDTFEAVSTAATNLGLSAAETSGALNAIQQMISKGTVSAEELRGQLGERIPGAFQIAARAMDMTTEELGKMLETGGLLTNEFLPKFIKQMGEEFPEAVQGTTKSVNDAKTAWLEFKQAFAESGAGDAITSTIDAYTDGLNGITEAIKRAKKEGAGFWGTLGAGIDAAMMATSPTNLLLGNKQSEQGQEQKRLLDLSTEYAQVTERIAQLEGTRSRNSHEAQRRQIELGRLREQQITMLNRLESEQAAGQAKMEDSAAVKSMTRDYEEHARTVEKVTKLKKSAADIANKGNEVQKIRNEIQDYEKRYALIKDEAEFTAGLANLKKQLADAEKKVAEEAKKGGSAGFNARNAQREGFVKLQKQLLDTEINDLEAAQKIAIGNEEKFIQQLADLKMRQLQIEEDAAKAGLNDARKSGDAQKAADQLAQIELIAAKRIEVQRNATREIQAIEAEAAKRNQDNIDKYLDGLRKEADALEQANANFGKTAKDLKNEEALRNQVAAATALQTLELGKANAGPGDEAKIAALQQQYDMLNGMAEAAQRASAAMTEGELLEQEKKAWEKRNSEAKQAAQNIEQWFTDAFLNSFGNGKSFFKQLMDSIKAMAARWIIQPIISPIAGAMGGFGMGGGVGGTAIGSTIDTMASGGNVTNLLSMGKKLWDGFSSGFNGMIGNGINQLGNAIGSEALMQFGNGMSGFGGSSAAAQMGARISPFANYAMGIGTGISAGRMIGGGYSLTGGTGNSTINIGTAIGAFMGPFGAAIGGAIGGLVNRAFGRGPKQYGEQGIEGTFNRGDFTGSTFADWKQKGGWFRSDKSGTDRAPLDAGTTTKLVQAYKAMEKTAQDAGKAMGVATGQLAGFSGSMRVVFEQGDTAEQQMQKVQQAFGKVADDMARMVIPGLDAYREGQESAAEALTRLATEFQATSAAVEMIGKDSSTAFGAVGVASIGARQSLIDLAGGLDQLMALTESFNANYLTEAERASLAQKQLAKQTADLGLSSVKSKEELKAMVMAQGAGTDADRERLVELLKLAKTYDEVTKMEAALAEEARQAAMAMNTVKLALAAMGLTAQQVSEKARTAGGGEQFGANLGTYLTEFEGEATGAAAALGSVVLELGKLGQPLTFTKEGFRGLVEDAKAGMVAARPGADQLFGSLISLAPAFASAANAVKQMIDASGEAVRNAERGVESAQDGVNQAYARIAEARARVDEVHAQRQQALDAEARQAEEADRGESRRLQAQYLQDSRRDEDLARQLSRRDEDRARQESARDAERVRQDESKAADRARQDMLRAIDQARQIARRDEDRARQDARRDEDRARQQMMKNAERARQDELRAQERALNDARRLEDRAIAARRRAEDKARADAIKSLEKSYDEAQKRAQKAGEKLNDARSDLTNAYNKESAAIKQTMDRFKSFAKSLRNLRDDLRNSDLSPQTPEEKYFDLLEQLKKLLPQAKAGDEDAQARVQQIVQEWLASSRTLYSSSERYRNDFEYAQQLLADMAAYSEGQSSIAEQQLAALKQAVEAVLPDLIEKTISVQDAIAAFHAADAAFKEVEAAATAAQNEIENARETDQHLAELRLMEDIAIEDRRLADERAIEDNRLAQERYLEDRAITDAQHLEDIQAAQDRMFEDQRFYQDLEWELERLAQERHLEDMAVAEARRQEDNQLAADRAFEDRRFAEDLEVESRRQAQDRHIADQIAAEDRAIQERDRQIAAQQAAEEYQRQVIAAEQAVNQAVQEGFRAERELQAAQDTLADAQRRHADNLNALARIEAAVRAQAAADAAAAAAAAAQIAAAVTQASDNAQMIAGTGPYSGQGGAAAPTAPAAPAAPRTPATIFADGMVTDSRMAEAGLSSWDMMNLGYFSGAANGMETVPYDNFRMNLHKGERVLTAAEASAYDMTTNAGIDFSRVGKNDGVKELVAEVRALRAEVTRLSSKTEAGTKAVVQSNYDANRKAAESMRDGVIEAAERSDYRQRKPIKLS